MDMLHFIVHPYWTDIKKDMKFDEGLKLLKECLKELETRMPIDFKGCYIKVVDKEGIKVVE